MADLKISDMTAASEVANADVVPVVQAGANVKASRALLLTAASGEAIALSGAGGTIQIDATGGIQVTPAGGQTFTFAGSAWPANAAGVLANDGGGNLTWAAGAPVLLGSSVAGGVAGALLRVDPTSLLNADGQVLWDGANLALTAAGFSAVTVIGQTGSLTKITDPTEIRLVAGANTLLDVTETEMGFFGAGPVVQPTAGGSSAMTGAGGFGGPVFSDSAFNGGIGASAFTIEDIVTALKSLGILAS